mmetsp:Transcript_171/g.142  ORF Transcript_171/g.142 Transcript_171/m.142 type:complete len:201 (-) Transcript_171:18-620(-)
MADEEAPSWLRDGTTSSSTSAPATNSGGYFSRNSQSTAPIASSTAPTSNYSSSSASSPDDPPYKWLIRYSFLIFNLGLAIMMCACGALGVANSTSVTDTGVVFVGIYMLIFGAILFLYEIAQIAPCSALDLLLKRNFGFLYGTFGKGAYLLFMGILAFGLSTPRNLAIGTGVVVAFGGVLQCLLFLYRPNWFDKKEKYVP